MAQRSFFKGPDGEMYQLKSPKPRNGKGIFGHLLGIALILSFVLVAMSGWVAWQESDKELMLAVWHTVSAIAYIIVGGFVGMAKELFSTKKEATMQDVIELIKTMRGDQPPAGNVPNLPTKVD